MQFQADWTLRVGALACLGVGFGDLDQSAPLGDSFYLTSWRFTFYQAKIGCVGGPGSQGCAPLNAPPSIPKHKAYSVLLCLVWKMKVGKHVAWHLLEKWVSAGRIVCTDKQLAFSPGPLICYLGAIKASALL